MKIWQFILLIIVNIVLITLVTVSLRREFLNKCDYRLCMGAEMCRDRYQGFDTFCMNRHQGRWYCDYNCNNRKDQLETFADKESLK